MIQNRIDGGIKKAALYIRVSTEEQAMHGVSLDAQKERLISFAKENNLTIVDIYADEGVTARKRYTRRAEMIRLLEDVKAKRVDVILFIKLDRWFRNIADFYEVQSILDRNRVQWVATEEDYDTTTANGRLALNIKLAIAQDESDRTSERIKFVFGNMVKDGRVISGSTPKGYKICDKRIVVNDDEVDLVKDLFNKVIELRSTKAAYRYILDKYGVAIDLKSIKKMVKNRMYIGEAYGIQGWCPAIIDQDTFDLANRVIDVRSARYDGTRSDRIYLFTGLLFCGCCGRRMTTYSCRNKNPDGSVRGEYIYYRCPSHAMKTCDMTKQINQDIFEKWLIENLVTEAIQHNAAVDGYNRQKKKSVDTAKILSKIEKLKDLYINDLLPKDIYERDYKALSSILADAEQIEPEQKKIDLEAIRNARNMYGNLTPQAKKAFWSKILEKVIVTPEGDYIVTLNQLK